MRTSDLRGATLEALGAGFTGLCLAAAISPVDLALRAPGPHVAWIAVIVIAARYGTEGLLLTLPLVWGPLVAVAGLLGAFAALQTRLDRADDLAAMVAAVLVGWIASTHERRHGDLAVTLEAARDRAAAQHALLGQFEDACLALGARADRLEVSLTFLRHVAARLEGGDPQAAAEATLQLAMARTGARAGLVQLESSGRSMSTLAAVGIWSASDAVSPNLNADRAVAAAFRTRQPVRAAELDSATGGDADLAAPLLDSAGCPVGVLALRGVPHGGTSPATLHDLAVVSGWLSAALQRSTADEAYEAYETDEADEADETMTADDYFEIRIFSSTALTYEGGPS